MNGQARVEMNGQLLRHQNAEQKTKSESTNGEQSKVKIRKAKVKVGRQLKVNYAKVKSKNDMAVPVHKPI